MRRTLSLRVLTLLLMAQAAAPARAPKDPSLLQSKEPSAASVKIDNFSFGPDTLTVSVGATVTWTNRDDVPHTVVSSDGVFKSKALDTDDQFSYTFTKPGAYPYFCSIHPKMTAKIIVQ